jgi:hypothetical protein
MLQRRDIAIATLFGIGAALYIAPFLSPGWQIYEDAAMLFRYAEHVAAGHGIVWNVGEPPVDGATDLLYMWILAGLHWLGIGLESAARGTSAAAHISTVALVYVGVRRFSGGNSLAAALSAVFVAIGPGKAYVAGGFGTPVFALCVTLTWLATLRLVEKPSTRAAIVCGILSVVMGIARPEGALLAALIVTSLFVYWHGSDARRFIYPIVVIGAVLGGTYWLWRWSYFGYPLPNPYYRKGGGRIYLSNFLITAKYGALLIVPFLAPLLLGLGSYVGDRHRFRATLLAAIPVFGFLAAWVLLSNEMNFFRRFQYPVVPIAAISWPLWIPDRIREYWRTLITGSPLQRAAIAVTATALLAVTVRYQHEAYFPPRWQDDLYKIGEMLAPYQDRGYTIAISEAGLIPFYSKWKAIDIWGLNDEWIAHHGVVTAAYLDRIKPEVVVFHAQCAPSRPADQWEEMEQAMALYTRNRPYVLAAHGDNGAGWSVLYYVRPDFPDAEKISSVFAAVVKSSAQPPAPLRACATTS